MLSERINRRSDNDIFSRSEFKMPTFHQIGVKDLSVIDEIGKIVIFNGYTEMVNQCLTDLLGNRLWYPLFGVNYIFNLVN